MPFLKRQRFIFISTKYNTEAHSLPLHETIKQQHRRVQDKEDQFAIYAVNKPRFNTLQNKLSHLLCKKSFVPVLGLP